MSHDEEFSLVGSVAFDYDVHLNVLANIGHFLPLSSWQLEAIPGAYASV